MKKHIGIIIITLMIAVICVLLSIVSFESVDSLLRPPRNEGENAEIQTAFESVAGEKYSLRSPLSGEYNSSFILVDLNGDGDDEVIVFYCYAESPDSIRINILDEIEDKWHSIADIETSYSDIHRVDFSDFDNDGKKEVVLGCSIYDTKLTNTLNVYKINGQDSIETVQNIFTKNYSTFLVCDVNSDGKTDLLVFEKPPVNNVHSGIKVTFYDFRQSKVYSAGEYFTDPIITSVSSVKFDNHTSEGIKSFYVDGFTADSGMTTDIFHWDDTDKCFQKNTKEGETSVTVAAMRDVNVVCDDINGDSFIEIPFEETIPASSVISDNSNHKKKQSVIKWMRLKDGEFLTAGYELINAAKGYRVKLSADWFGKFTVKNDFDTGLLTFYSLKEIDTTDEEKKKKPKKKPEDPEAPKEDEIFVYNDEDILFTILATPESGNTLYELSGYRFIKSDNGYSYYCQIYDKGKETGFTKEIIKNILIT